MMRCKNTFSMFEQPDWFSLQRAAFWVAAGGVVAHATEGVWGLACNPFNPDAVNRLLEIKNRRVGLGLILIGADEEMFADQLALLSEESRERIQASWPGAHTWIVPHSSYPKEVSGGRDSVAVRVPGHKQARRLCTQVGHPVVSTSANISGRSPALTALMARSIFGDRVDFYLPGQVGLEGSDLYAAGFASQISDARSHRVVRRASGG